MQSQIIVDKMTQSTIACIQLSSGAEISENLRRIEVYTQLAVDMGAECVMLPECATVMEESFAQLRARAAPEDTHMALDALRAMAEQHKIWVLVGSLPIMAEYDERLYNRCYLLNPAGDIVARYDKIHLFDAVIAGKRYTESERYIGGDRAVVVDTPFGKLGLSICYDVRFPHLYRQLAKAGAEVLCVPAAFTRKSGEAHWHVLLRARAIENGCYVVAPAQTGSHPGDRETYGHSLIVDPWGAVLSDGGEAEGVIVHTIDRKEVSRRREQLPSLYHDREFHF